MLTNLKIADENLNSSNPKMCEIPKILKS